MPAAPVARQPTMGCQGACERDETCLLGSRCREGAAVTQTSMPTHGPVAAGATSAVGVLETSPRELRDLADLDPAFRELTPRSVPLPSVSRASIDRPVGGVSQRPS